MPERLPPASRLRLHPGTPVLPRPGGRIQVGLEPPAALILAGPGSAELVGGLDGETELAVLQQRVTAAGMAAGELDRALAALDAAGLLTSATSPGGLSPTPHPPVRLVGLGPLGQQVAQLLLGAGVHVYAADPDRPGGRPPGPLPWPELAGGPGPGAGRLTVVNHWRKPDHVDPRLTVVALDTVEPDRTLTDVLLRADEPHLVLRATATVATVGPLVLPGRSACLRCTDLARRDRDPGWPALLAELTRLRLPPTPVLLGWTAALGAAQVLAHLEDRVPEAAGATIELGRDHLMRWRPWPVHAGCGCAWASTTEWGP